MDDDQGFTGINVIPFIDIMLVLLTIVLTTATFIAGGSIPVNLPKAEQGEAAEPGLMVEIDRDGTAHFQGQAYDRETLRAMLLQEDRQRPLLIRADRAVVLQSFVDVLSTIRELGFTTMSLQTETPNG